MRRRRAADPERARAYNREANARWRRANPEASRAIAVRHAQRLKAVIDDAKSVPCAACGNKFPPAAMDFHHRNAAEKSFNIGSFRGSAARLAEEIAKCDVLCACCHRTLP